MTEKPGKKASAAADFPPKELTAMEIALKEAGLVRDVGMGETAASFSAAPEEGQQSVSAVSEANQEEIAPDELIVIYGEKVPKRALEAFKKLKSPEKIKSFLKLKSEEEKERQKKVAERKAVRGKGKSSSKRKPKVAPAVQVGETEPFDPHSVASAMDIEAQQQAQKAKELLAAGGMIPLETVRTPDVNIDEARATHLATDSIIKAIAQGDMDELAGSEPIPPDASIRRTSQLENDALVATPETAALEAVEADVQRQIVENRKNRAESLPQVKPAEVSLDIDLTEPGAGISNSEGTPKEWREKLKGLIMGAKEKVSWYTSSSEKLIRRNEELDAQAEKIGGTEKLFRTLGERYNKMGWKSKLALGASLGLGAGISAAAVSVPAMTAFVLGIGAQRAAGLASMYMKFEKAAPHGEKKGEKFWQWGQKEKAMAKAILYTAGMTAGMAYAVKEISETEMAHRTQQWLGDTFSKIYGAISGGTDAAPSPVPAARVEVPKQAPAVAPEIEAPTAETPPPASASVATTAPEVAPKAPLAAQTYQQQPTAAAPVAAHASAAAHEAAPAAPLAAAKLDSTVTAAPNAAPLAAAIEGQRVGIDDDTRRRAAEWLAANEKAADAAPLAAAATGDTAPTVVQAGTPSGEAEGVLTRESPIEIKNPPAEGAFDLTSSQDAQQKIFDAANQPPSSVEAASTGIASSTEAAATFTNASGVSIDPAQTQIFQAEGGAVVPFGGTSEEQFNAAQDFAKAHPGTSVFVQADKPVLYDGKLAPFVFEVRYDKGVFGIGGGMKILGADGPIDSSHIGALDPNTFIKQIDLGPKGGLGGVSEAIKAAPQVVVAPEASAPAPAPAAEAAPDAFAAAKAQEALERAADAKAEAARLIAEAQAKDVADTASRMAAEKATQEAIAAQQLSDEAAKAIEAQERAADIAAAAKAESARLLAEAKANEAVRIAAERAQEEAAAATRAATEKAAQEAVAAKVEAARVTVEDQARIVPNEAPAQAPKAPAPEVGSIPSNKVLNTLSTEQLDKWMTPEATKLAEVQKLKMLSIFGDQGFMGEKGVNSAFWKAVSDKPIEFLFAPNDSSVMKRIVNSGLVDSKYLNNPVAFLQEVLGIEKDAHSVGISARFKDLAGVVQRNIPPLPEETVASYVARASKVFALRK